LLNIAAFPYYFFAKKDKIRPIEIPKRRAVKIRVFIDVVIISGVILFI